MQLAEKLLFEDAEVVNQMKQLIADMGPGVSLFTSCINFCSVYKVYFKSMQYFSVVS